MGNCCISIKEDLYNEIRKDNKMYDFETKDNEDFYTITSMTKEKREQILFEIKDNPYEEYSKALLQKLNEIRQNPALFFNMTGNDIVNGNDYYYNGPKSTPVSMLTWSTKKSMAVSDYFNNKLKGRKQCHTKTINDIKTMFNKDFIVSGYYCFGSIMNTNNTLSNMIANMEEKEKKAIILNDYSYCVIYSDECDKDTILSYLFFFSHI